MGMNVATLDSYLVMDSIRLAVKTFPQDTLQSCSEHLSWQNLYSFKNCLSSESSLA